MAGRGGSGAGGAAGAAGAAGRGGSTGTAGAPATGQSVLERNKNPSRDGHFIQPRLTRAAVANMTAETAFAANFSGTMWASPLYLQNGPGGTGVFIVVTTGNDIFAIHETNGSTVWRKNIGSSPTDTGGGCGAIHPLGIVSTPVIDAATRTLYVAGAIGTNSIQRHEVHALSVDDGSSKTGWPVDVSTSTSGSITFDTVHQNQRGALSLVGGTLYVPYGGHIGDCGGYHGWVVGINTQNPTQRGAWATGGQGEGIWASGGMASDGNGVIAVTGNATTGRTDHLDSEEVARITGVGTLADSFYPADWRTMDSRDADLGSVNPMYIEVPGATPSKMVVAMSKDGRMFMLDAAALGGMGGQKVEFRLAANGDSIKNAPTAYRTPQGTHVAVALGMNAMGCPSGSGQVVMSVRIPQANPPTPQVIWCAPQSGTNTSPITTTIDGENESIVWYMSNGRLIGVNGETGVQIYSSSNTCTGSLLWTSPIAVNNRIVVGAGGRLCSWSVP
jgi:hypothetical protein